MSMAIEQKAERNTADLSFVHQYGNDVTELIDAPADSSALNLGCGNGL